MKSKWLPLCGHVKKGSLMEWVCVAAIHDRDGARNNHYMKSSKALTAIERVRTGYGGKR